MKTTVTDLLNILESNGVSIDNYSEDGIQVVNPSHETPEFWGVYVSYDEVGFGDLWQNVADFKDEKSGSDFVKLLSVVFGLPLSK